MSVYFSKSMNERCDICDWEYLVNSRVHHKTILVAYVEGYPQHLLIKCCNNCKEKDFPMTWPLITKITSLSELIQAKGKEVKLVYMPFDLFSLPLTLAQLEATF